jgi:hypothetical protein
MQGVKRILR